MKGQSLALLTLMSLLDPTGAGLDLQQQKIGPEQLHEVSNQARAYGRDQYSQVNESAAYLVDLFPGFCLPLACLP